MPPKRLQKKTVRDGFAYPDSFKGRSGEGPHSARLRYELEYRAGQHQYPSPDAFPNRPHPCKGKFLKNGNFVTDSGRHVSGRVMGEIL